MRPGVKDAERRGRPHWGLPAAEGAGNRTPEARCWNPVAMVEVITDMPAGTLGFRLSERLTREDYEVLVPPLRSAVEAGRRLRVLYAIGPELHMEPGAVMEDLKVEVDLGIRHRDAWERIAVVTDLDWLKRAFAMFSFMVPGEMKLFAESGMDEAKGWLR